MISDRPIRQVLEQFDLVASHPSANEIQIVLDASLSMTTGDGSKEVRARELAMLLLKLAHGSPSAGSLWAVRGDDRDRYVESNDADRVTQVPFDGNRNLAECWPERLDKAVQRRVVISDFLYPCLPAELVERAARRVDKLWMIQLLDGWEIDPAPAGVISLVDPETEEAMEIMLDSNVVEAYKRTLEAFQQKWFQACADAGATWVSVATNKGLESVCRNQLVPAGLLVSRTALTGNLNGKHS